MTGQQVIKALQKSGWVIDRRTYHWGKIDMNRLQALYPARIWKEDDVYYVQFLDLDNGFTFGKNLAHAKEMAADVLSALLSSALAHHESIPVPKKVQGKDIYLIAPNTKVQIANML